MARKTKYESGLDPHSIFPWWERWLLALFGSVLCVGPLFVKVDNLRYTFIDVWMYMNGTLTGKSTDAIVVSITAFIIVLVVWVLNIWATAEREFNSSVEYAWVAAGIPSLIGLVGVLFLGNALGG